MRFEQRQEQMIRVSPNYDRLTLIVANQLTTTDERFWDAFYGAAPRLRFQPIDCDFFGFLPRGESSFLSS